MFGFDTNKKATKTKIKRWVYIKLKSFWTAEETNKMKRQSTEWKKIFANHTLTIAHCWWECKLVQLLWKPVWRFLKGLKIELSWSSNSTSRYLSKGTKNTNLKRYMHPMFIEALFTVTKTWKQSKCPSMDEWMKENVVYTYDGILFSH